MRRFVKDHGALLAAQTFKVLAAAFVRGGQKSLEAEPARRQRGQRNGRNQGGRAGHDKHLNSAVGAHAHKLLAGVGYGRHAGVGHERAVFSGDDALENFCAGRIFVVLEIAHERLAYVEVVEQLHRNARVLCGDEVGVAQRLFAARRKVAEVADRRSNQE